MNDKITLFNPLNHDVVCHYDIHGNRQPVTYVIYAKTVMGFDPIVGRHMKKVLATEVLNARGIKRNAEFDLAEINQEIEL